MLRVLLGDADAQLTDELDPAALAAAAGFDQPRPGPAQPAPAPPQQTRWDQPPSDRTLPPAALPARHGRNGAVLAVSGAVVAVAVAAVAVAVLLGGPDGTTATPGPGGTATVSATPPSTPPATPEPTPQSTLSPTGSPSPGGPTDDPASGWPDRFAGEWSGSVTQNDGKVLTVRLSLPAGARTGRVSYPGESCAGTVTLLGEPGGGGPISLVERITVNPRACVDTGTITLTPQGGGLYFSYRGTSGGTTWTVRGPLSRTR